MPMQKEDPDEMPIQKELPTRKEVAVLENPLSNPGECSTGSNSTITSPWLA
jgi:hypothetical protein